MTIKEYLESATPITNHITRTYVSLADKQNMANAIIKLTYYDEEGNFRPNEVGRYMLNALAYVDLYTDLERSENALEDFDALNEHRIFDAIKEALPPQEVEEFEFVLRTTEEEVRSAENRPPKFLKTLAQLIDESLPDLEDLNKDEVLALFREYFIQGGENDKS